MFFLILPRTWAAIAALVSSSTFLGPIFRSVYFFRMKTKMELDKSFQIMDTGCWLSDSETRNGGFWKKKLRGRALRKANWYLTSKQFPRRQNLPIKLNWSSFDLFFFRHSSKYWPWIQVMIFKRCCLSSVTLCSSWHVVWPDYFFSRTEMWTAWELFRLKVQDFVVFLVPRIDPKYVRWNLEIFFNSYERESVA